MSRTYDALKKAEAERTRQEGISEIAEEIESQRPLDRDFQVSPGVEEQCQRIHTALIAGKGKKVRSLMLVGANHGDGVTTIVSLLAKMLTNGRSVLVVDANFRTPTLANVLRVRVNGGLADFLAGKVSLDKVIAQTSTPNLSVISSGSAPLAALHLFEDGKFDELLASLRERFDHVVFDTAPLARHLDAICIARRVDGVILVVKAESTPVEAGQEMKKKLDEAGAPILGVVVNQTQDYVPRFLRQLLS